MDSSSHQGEGKNNIPEIKTNSPSKPSKEQIINQARKLHKEGNILKAEKYYQYCINQGFNDHRVFSNYGVILRNLGNLEDAVLSTRKAIELKPDYAKTYSNLGLILSDLGKSQEAFDSYLKSIEINPTVSDIYTSITSFLKSMFSIICRYSW